MENGHSKLSRCLFESEIRKRSDFIDMQVPSRSNVFHKLKGSSWCTMHKNPVRGEMADRRTKILKDAWLNSSPGGGEVMIEEAELCFSSQMTFLLKKKNESRFFY